MRRSFLGIAPALAALVAASLSTLFACAPTIAETAGSGGASSSSAAASSVASVASTTASSSSASSSSSSSTGGGNVGCDPAATDAVAFQINPQHTGAQADPTFAPPLTKRWTVDFEGPVSYPIIADGKVFVTAASADPHGGTTLVALDAATGSMLWPPIALPSYCDWSNAAYENGQLFVVDWLGQVQAFDAGSGARLWAMPASPGNGSNAPPVALGGVVYVGTVTQFFAVDEATGDRIWLNNIAQGARNGPAVSDAAVFSAFFNGVTALSSADGVSTWSEAVSERSTPVLCGGDLFARDDSAGVVLDPATGANLGSYDADAIAAFSGTQGFFLVKGELQARDIASLTLLWTFHGDGQLVTPPIVVGSTVYIGSATGTLFAVDVASGAKIWSDAVGGPMAAPNDDDQVAKLQPQSGLAEANGVLVVPAGSKLVAYAP